MCAVCIPEGSAGPSSRFEIATSGRCVQPPWPEFPSFHTQPLSFHILIDSASVNPFGTHTSKKSQIYIKTKAFKPFMDTYLQGAFSQSLLNHILNKNWDGGGGTPSTGRQSPVTGDSWVYSEHGPRLSLPALLHLPSTEHGPRLSLCPAQKYGKTQDVRLKPGATRM